MAITDILNPACLRGADRPADAACCNILGLTVFPVSTYPTGHRYPSCIHCASGACHNSVELIREILQNLEIFL